MNMKVVLYDEGMYLSGSAHGQVVATNASFASKGIRLLEEKPAHGEIITQFPDGKYLVYDYTQGTIRGIHFGEDDGEAGAPASADILNPEVVDCFIHLTHDCYYKACLSILVIRSLPFSQMNHVRWDVMQDNSESGFRDWRKKS